MRYFRCLDTEDWEGMRQIWRPDGKLRAVGARPRDGIDGVIEYFSKLFDPWPEHVDRPTRVLVHDDAGTVLAEVTFTGRTRDGREVAFDAVDVFDLVGGQIAKLSNWYDVDYARRVTAPREPEEA